MGETKYLANMQIHTACHCKYQNKRSFPQTSAIHSPFRVARWRDCAPLFVTSPHCALMLPASMSSDLAGNIGRAILEAIQSLSNASAMTVTATASITEPPQHTVSLFSNSQNNVNIKLANVSPVEVIFARLCS